MVPWRAASGVARFRPLRHERLARPDAVDAIFFFLMDDQYQGICLPDEECQGIILADDQCQGICLLDTQQQGIPIDACHCIYFQTALASTYTASNPCQPCICVLDKDGHCSSLLDDVC